jgi:PAS domain-containing protein
MRLFSLPLELSALLALALALAVGQRRASTRGRRTFVLMCLAITAIAVGELLTVRGVVSEHVGDRIKYAGVLTLAPLWLGFAAQIAGLELARRVPWFPALLLTPGAFVYPLMWSSAYGGLFMTTVEGGDDVYGPLWVVVTVYGQALCVGGSAILVSAALRIRDRRRALRTLVVALVPLLALTGSAFHTTGHLNVPYDPTPVMLGAALLLMRDSLLGSGLLDPVPFPQRELLRQLPLGLILTDRGGAVSLINGAAARTFGMAPADALGRDVESLLASRRPAALADQALSRRGRAAGRLLTFESS